MLVPRRMRLLTVEPRDHPRGQGHLSSASGIARVGGRVYIVADDEHHLACLDAADPQLPIRLARFLPGELPREGAERKQRKPDVEVLLQLPGLLVLLGSGSRPQRERAFAVALDPEGGMVSDAVELPASGFYAPLRDLFGETNLEAGYADGAHVHLFQRANRGQAMNSRITYDAEELGAWLRGRSAGAPRPLAVRQVALGDHEGVPFGITDAAAWAGPGCLCTAVAEDTLDAYRDGACVASMVGWLGADGELLACELLSGSPKVEGIAPAGAGRLWLVTDADDPERPSELLEVEWDPKRRSA